MNALDVDYWGLPYTANAEITSTAADDMMG
jgi:hypothetical protein